MTAQDLLNLFHSDTNMYLKATGTSGVFLQENGNPIFTDEDKAGAIDLINDKIDKYGGNLQCFTKDDICHIAFQPRASRQVFVSEIEKQAVNQVETYFVNSGRYAWQIDFYINTNSNEVSNILLSNRRTNLFYAVPDKDLHCFMFQPFDLTGNPKSDKEDDALRNAQIEFMDACLDISLSKLRGKQHNEIRDAFWKHFNNVFCSFEERFYIEVKRTQETHYDRMTDRNAAGTYTTNTLIIGETEIAFNDDEGIGYAELVCIGLFRRMMQLDSVYKLQHPFTDRKLNKRFSYTLKGHHSAVYAYSSTFEDEPNAMRVNFSGLSVYYKDKNFAQIDQDTWNTLFGFRLERF